MFISIYELLTNLKTTSFRYNTKVKSLKDGEITLEDSTQLESHYTIVATEASDLISNLKNQSTAWKSCVTLYFETESRVIDKRLIGLIPKSGALINNIFYNRSLETVSDPQNELLSVTVIDAQGFSNASLVEAVKKELNESLENTLKSLDKEDESYKESIKNKKKKAKTIN